MAASDEHDMGVLFVLFCLHLVFSLWHSAVCSGLVKGAKLDVRLTMVSRRVVRRTNCGPIVRSPTGEKGIDACRDQK